MAANVSATGRPPSSRALRRALSYLAGYRLPAAGALISLVAVSALSLVGPWLLEWAIDAGIRRGDLGNVRLAALALVGVAAVRGVFSFLQGYWSEAASQGVAYDLRNGIYGKLQRLSFSYHDQAQTGQLLTRVTSDVEGVRQFVGLGFLQLASAVTLLAGSTAVLLWFDWRLALAALSIVPLVLVTLIVFIRRIRPRFGEAQARLGVVNTVLQENIAGARVVRAFAAEAHEARRYQRANGALLEEWLGIIRVFATSFPFIFFLSNVGTLIVFWVGGLRVLDGALSVGRLVAFNAYLAMLLVPLFMLGGLAATLSRASASAERVFEVMDAEIEVVDRPGALALDRARGHVVFDDVWFRYVGAEAPVLRGVTVDIPPGQTVALLGGTGSGKSTVINLIPRFYDVTRGRVLVDGHDVRHLAVASLRANVGVVLQDTVLFSGTVRENIAFGRPDAALADVERAAGMAQAHDFIVALPQGYDTLVGERGVRLSGGQKQRVAIARALLLDPPVLILDDALSAVDVETEARIQQALAALLRDRTAFVIAQRLSTVMLADRILVVEGGRVVGDGTHEGLLATNAAYGDMVTSQLLDDLPPLRAEAAP